MKYMVEFPEEFAVRVCTRVGFEKTASIFLARRVRGEILREVTREVVIHEQVTDFMAIRIDFFDPFLQIYFENFISDTVIFSQPIFFNVFMAFKKINQGIENSEE